MTPEEAAQALVDELNRLHRECPEFDIVPEGLTLHVVYDAASSDRFRPAGSLEQDANGWWRVD